MGIYRYIIATKIPSGKPSRFPYVDLFGAILDKIKERLSINDSTYDEIWAKIPENSKKKKIPYVMENDDKIVFHTVDLFFESGESIQEMNECVSGYICHPMLSRSMNLVQPESRIFAGPFPMEPLSKTIELHLYATVNYPVPYASRISIYKDDIEQIEDVILTEKRRFSSFPDYISGLKVSIDGAELIRNQTPLTVSFFTGAIIFSEYSYKYTISLKRAFLLDMIAKKCRASGNIPFHIAGPKNISEAQLLDIDPNRSKLYIVDDRAFEQV